MTIAERDAQAGAEGIEAGEYQLYRGLDQIFTETQTLPTTRGVRNDLGMMIIQMDQALRAFEAGNTPAALEHHKQMLGYSSAVLRETETLTGRSETAKAEGARNVAPDVRVLLTTLLTTAVAVTGDENKQPWARTLEAVSDAYKAKRAEEVAKLTLATDAEVKASIAAAEKPPAPARASVEKIVLAAGNFPTRFAQEAPAQRQTVWSRPEYKNLSMVLEGVKKEAHDHNARREATVALACLKSINNREIDMLARQRGNRPLEDAETAREVKEYAGRLNEYVSKLQRNTALSVGIKANLKRFAPPAQTAAQGLQRVLGKNSGSLSRTFRFAVAVGGKLLGKWGAAPARQGAIAAPNEKPHS